MTSKNIQRYYTLKCLTRDLLSNCFNLLAFLPKIFKESFVWQAHSRHFEVVHKYSANWFQFRWNFSAEIPYQMRKKPVQYIDMKLAEFLSKVKNWRIRPKVNYWTKWVWHWLSQNKITFGKRTPLWKLFAKSKYALTHVKLLQTYLHSAFFSLDPFSIVFWWVLCRVTVARTVNNNKNNSEDFGDSVKKSLEVWCVRKETKKV